ncbi:MAG: DHCW motif cupin fold protein [Terriglobales bacterium]
MKLDTLPIGTTDWSLITPSVQQGGLGTATKRIRQFGDIKIRLIEFSANFVSDQWCHKGHIVFVVAGGVTIVHQNGQTYPLSLGGTYHVSDDFESPHRLESQNGATIFVVD